MQESSFFSPLFSPPYERVFCIPTGLSFPLLLLSGVKEIFFLPLSFSPLFLSFWQSGARGRLNFPFYNDGLKLVFPPIPPPFPPLPHRGYGLCRFDFWRDGPHLFPFPPSIVSFVPLFLFFQKEWKRTNQWSFSLFLLFPKRPTPNSFPPFSLLLQR